MPYPPPRFPIGLLTAFATVVIGCTATWAADEVSERRFEERIRPILADRCYECHGEEKQESGLRMDSRDAILRGGDRGPAALPEQVDASLLVQAIRHVGELSMPPDAELVPADVEALERWIETGMFWPPADSSPPAASDPSPQDEVQEHWAYQPIRRHVPLPGVTNRAWPRTPVDRFVLNRLEQAGLTPSSPADRRVLIRRVTFDLIGLPPTPDEVAAFCADTAVDAYARLVDRLLQSPRYGERWGRHWLDVARYADNKGYVFFEAKEFAWAWTYRDWVIRSFNDDLPFEPFVVRQLAADQSDLDERPADLAAMGFLTVGARFTNNVHDVLDDRIDVVTRGLLGLTVTCARCHDHKFDPIPQADYYSLYGVFRSSVEPILPPLIDQESTSDEYVEFNRVLEEKHAALTRFVEQQRQEIMRGARERAAEYLLAVHAKRNQPSTENFMLLTDKGALIPAVIHRWEMYLKRMSRQHDPVWTVWNRFAELSDDEFGPSAASLHAELFLSDRPAAAVGEEINPLVASRFQASAPQSIQEVAQRYGELFRTVDETWAEQLRCAQEQGAPIPLSLPDPHQEQLRQALYGQQSPAVLPLLDGWGFLDLLPDRETQEEYKKLKNDLEEYSSKQPAAPPRAMVLVDLEPAYEPVVFLRGNPNRHGDAVPRRFLQVLSPADRLSFSVGSGRRELAEAIVDPQNPLTARVFVNRVWHHHFGRGLVETTSDFGRQGQPPSHPELLDWLAAWFLDHGGSVKALHRLILSSAVYQQSNGESAKSMARLVDPDNRLLSRYERRKLEFEAIRDSLLCVSGQLQTPMGGEPTAIFASKNRRRTVYGFIDRMDLPGVMRTFDFPEPAATSPKRDATTVPSQSLFFLNNDFVTDCADQLLLRRDVRTTSDPLQRLDVIYQWVLGRSPSVEEQAWVSDFLEDHQDKTKAWQEIAHALLMMNEFVYVD